jgi:hypothetical protein
LGATAVEDKLQDQVIFTLIASHITIFLPYFFKLIRD